MAPTREDILTVEAEGVLLQKALCLAHMVASATRPAREGLLSARTDVVRVHRASEFRVGQTLEDA